MLYTHDRKVYLYIEHTGARSVELTAKKEAASNILSEMDAFIGEETVRMVFASLVNWSLQSPFYNGNALEEKHWLPL